MRALMIGLLAIGCAAAPPGPHAALHVSTRFTAEQQELVFFAVDEWAAATDGGFALRPVVTDDRDLDAWSIRPEGLGGGEAGRELNGQIAIDTDRIDWLAANDGRIERVSATLGTILHELGHGIGMQHAPVGLMSDQLADGARPCVDSYTLETACWHVDCGPARHETCGSSVGVVAR